MTTITLEQIEAEQAKVTKMIEAFKSQSATTEYLFPETEITLQPGEHYAGLILGKDGESSYHLIMLPGQVESVNWQKAKEWATEQNGELPTRREQSLLYANLKEQFDPNWYWSCEEHTGDTDYAWYQHFYYGYQGTNRKVNNDLRARAVRRLVIE